MIQKTQWSPDTCGCTLEYSWDDTEKQDARTHNITKVVKACVAHENLSSKEAHFTQVLGENTVKNRVLDIIEKTGLISKDEVQFSFDANRKLMIDAKGADAQVKSQIILEIESKEGQGKVTVA